MNNLSFYYNKSIKTSSHDVIAECVDIIEKTTGLRMYEEQIKAARALYQEDIVELETGGGKTLTLLLAAMLFLRDNRQVFLVTANDYLAKRDYEFAISSFRMIKKDARVLVSPLGGTSEAYEKADIIYAQGKTLVFDYLKGINQKLDVALIDEIDYILVESGTHTFAVGTGESNITLPENYYRISNGLIDVMTVARMNNSIKPEVYHFDLQYDADIIIDEAKEYCEITKRGYLKINDLLPGIIENRSFMEAFYSCLTANFILKKDIHYLVKWPEILLIDSNSGRIGKDCHYELCLETALQVKEGLPITEKFLYQNDISFAVYFLLFKTVTGISGTAKSVPFDFKELLGRNVKTQKAHYKSKRNEFYEYYETREKRIKRIKEIIRNTDSPVLVVTASDKNANEIYQELEQEFKDSKVVEVLCNRNIETENVKLEMLKERNTVLVSNRIVGRGTDITVMDDIKTGLIVIIAERFKSKRAELQLIGRTGRNGKQGTCYVLTSAEDNIYSLSFNENPVNCEREIKALQRRHEAVMYDQRKYLYIRDRLFFLMDKAVMDRLRGIESYEEIEEYLSGYNKLCEKKVKEIINKGYLFLKEYPRIINFEYQKIRPIFQQQYYTYTNNMTSQFLNNDYFGMLEEVYLNMGREVIRDTLSSFISKL